MAACLNSIGIICNGQGDSKEALIYYQRSLKLRQELGNLMDISGSLNNIGIVYFDLKDDNKALQYYLRSLKIKEKIGDELNTATCINNIGEVYARQRKYEKAIEYFTRSLDLNNKYSRNSELAMVLNNLGALFIKKGQIEKGKELLTQGLKLGQEFGYIERIKNAAHGLYKAHKKQENRKYALEMYELYVQMRDSIKNEKTHAYPLRQSMQHEYEMQKAIDDAEHDKQIMIEQEQKRQQEIISYSIGGGLALVVLFLAFVYNRLRLSNKQKKIIEQQKDEVEQQKSTIELAYRKTERQKEVIEESHKEIRDSINYAKRIQSAILPPAKLVKKHLKESFIYYKPKDVVAGDFYWMEPSSQGILFAAADCTGHGVPGAMVSVVCNNALNRSVREYGFTDPGKILDKTRELVIDEFNNSEEEVKDGMDIALCLLSNHKLSFSGANNPLWIIRNREVLEYKANKQPIGTFDNLLPFTTHTIDIEKGIPYMYFLMAILINLEVRKERSLKLWLLDPFC